MREGHTPGSVNQGFINRDTRACAQASLEVNGGSPKRLQRALGSIISLRAFGVEIVGVSLQSEDKSSLLPVVADLPTAGEVRVFRSVRSGRPPIVDVGDGGIQAGYTHIQADVKAAPITWGRGWRHRLGVISLRTGECNLCEAEEA